MSRVHVRQLETSQSQSRLDIDPSLHCYWIDLRALKGYKAPQNKSCNNMVQWNSSSSFAMVLFYAGLDPRPMTSYVGAAEVFACTLILNLKKVETAKKKDNRLPSTCI